MSFHEVRLCRYNRQDQPGRVIFVVIIGILADLDSVVMPPEVKSGGVAAGNIDTDAMAFLEEI